MKKYFLALILALLCAFSFAACKGGADNGGDTGSGNGADTQAWGEWIITPAATCEAEGVETRVSKADSAVIQTRSVAAIGHDWNVWQVATEPSCSVSGVEKRICNDCGNFDFQPVAALGHEWGEWEVATAPTCDKSGIEMSVCQHDDNHTDVRQVAALGHDFGAWVIATKPTCEAGGVETKFCRNDNGHTQTRSVEPLGHDFTEWVITIEMTPKADGEEMRLCRNNKNHVETRVIYTTGTEGLTFTLINDNSEYSAGAADKTISGEVVIPAYYNGKPVTALRSSAFYNCREITSVTIPDSVITIGTSAFHSCVKLENVSLPSGLITIENFAFSYCGSLKDLALENCKQLQKIGDNMFYRSALTAMIIPASVEKLGFGVFLSCEELISVVFEKGSPITYLFPGMFLGCKKLETVVIPAITGWGNRAFDTSTQSTSGNLSAIYFCGNEADWEAIYLLESNQDKPSTLTGLKEGVTNLNIIADVAVYYYSETENTDGAHWRYVGGVPAIWA